MNLKGKQLQFMEAMLESSTTQEAINKAGIARSTAYKYLNDDNFKHELLRARTEAMSQVTARLQMVSNHAVDTIIDLMNDKETPAYTRLHSAKAIIDNAYKGLEYEYIVQRMEEIEKQLENN